MIRKLSIIIPVYNEESTIQELLNRVMSVKLIHGISKEIIIIDDSSRDNSVEIINQYIYRHGTNDIQFHMHEINKGKGAAIRTGIQYATGDFVIMQDADLELNPEEYNLLLRPIIDGMTDVVYGSRFLNKKQKGGKILAKAANSLLTSLTNLVLGIKITDMETCYKLMKTTVIKSIDLKEERFGFEPEITAKISRKLGLKIMEIPISYNPRTQEHGKKIRWTDGLHAIFCIIKYGWFNN